MDSDDPERRIAAEQVHNIAFSKPPFGKRGYDQDEPNGVVGIVRSITD